MDRTISLACGVLPEFGPETVIEAAAKAGFPAAGVRVHDEWTASTTRNVQRRLQDTGLALLDVEVVWILPGQPDPDPQRIVEIGAELGAPNVLVVSRDPDMGATAAAFARLCETAEPLGLRVALEFGLFTEVKTIGNARDIAEGTGSPAAAILVDPIHLARSGGSPGDVAEVPRHIFGYAQFCDAPAIGPDPDDAKGILREALDGRLQVGEGALPLRALLDALPDRLPLSIELRSKALRDAHPDPAERARAVAAATLSFLASAPGQTNPMRSEVQ